MHPILGIFLISGIMGLFFALFSLLVFVFWIWMLVSAITNKALGDGEKIAWVLVIIFLNLLGAAIYFFVKHSKAV
jgi:hypothetical protein